MPIIFCTLGTKSNILEGEIDKKSNFKNSWNYPNDGDVAIC